MARTGVGLFALVMMSAVAMADPKATPVAAPPASGDDIVRRIEAITSRSAHAASDVPRFAFTGNLTLEQPATLDEVVMGLPAIALADKTKTLVAFPDPDTAWISTHLGEYDACGKAGCGKQAPDSWLRATAVFERSWGIWQPVAWSITPSIPGTSQAQALADGTVPDKLGRTITGAEDVVKQFEATIGDPKALAATISDRKEAVLMGSELAERYAGPQAAKQIAAWAFAFKLRDGLRAGVNKSGNVAWVAANVDATSAKRPKAKAIPYRLFVIYEKTAGAWKIVQLQFSTAV